MKIVNISAISKYMILNLNGKSLSCLTFSGLSFKMVHDFNETETQTNHPVCNITH